MYKQFFNSPLEIKSVSEYGIIKGYASVFDITDFHNDMLAPGAFNKTLSSQSKYDVKFLWQHKIEEPIGIIAHIEEDSYGLYIEANLLLDVQKAAEAYSLINAGSVKGLSIGYHPLEYYYDNEVRVITEVDLKEISLVTFPANKDSIITHYKDLK